jgi:hypothetical protein
MVQFHINEPKNDQGNNCATKKSHIETSAALLNVPAKAKPATAEFKLGH